MQDVIFNLQNYESYYFDIGSFEIDSEGIKFEGQSFNGFCIDEVFWDYSEEHEKILMGSTIIFVNYE